MREIVLNGFNYLICDNKRVIRGLLYSLYLWIFFKRFIQMIISILNFCKNGLFVVLKSVFKFIFFGSWKGVRRSKIQGGMSIAPIRSTFKLQDII